MTDDRLVTLVKVTYLTEADLLCSKLEASGIKTLIPDQSTAAMQPLYSSALGGIRVQVLASDLARAQEILKDALPPAARGIFTCPQCGSDSVSYEKIFRRFAFLSLLLLGIPLLWYMRRCSCSSCGHRWKQA